MRVEQQNSIIEALQQNNGTETKGNGILFPEKSVVKKAEGSDNTSVFIKDATYIKPSKEEKSSIVEEMEKNASMDALDRKNQMAVLSNTTSEEDYEKMQEEGFSLDATGSRTIVTVTDKIKIQRAKAGKDVSFYGDEPSMEQLEAATGSAALATQLERTLKEADLPATEENMQNAMEAMEQATALNPLTDGAAKYMLDNKLEPTIENIYKAEYSGSSNYTAPPAEGDFSELSGQIEKVITAAGLDVNEETMAQSQWLLANEIPLTKENLLYLNELKNLEIPLDNITLMGSIATAISEGKAPKDAMLVEGYSLVDQAAHAVEVVNEATDEDLNYLINQDMELTVDNLELAAAHRGQGTEVSGSQEVYTDQGLRLLTAQRQLEEIRLAMTAEANYALLKQGISIDTEPLVKLVEALKNTENQYYANLLSAQGAEPSEENIALFAETIEKVQTIQAVPAYVLGIPEADTDSINGVYDEGTALKSAMEKANQSYEPLMTAPRADLGDSIQKAFSNVETILADLGMETSEENQRAVRILAYNSLDITEEAILRMKAADEEVQRTFRNLSPAVVTEMIKQRINPLEMDFATLNQTAEALQAEVGKDDNERFSEYLWKLEQNHSITEEERSTYIGIYRLIHQVEQTDGAAIGALVNQGVEPTMKNLLTAVRSEKKSNKMDISVDDKVGEAETSGKLENSITDQIMSAYQTNCLKDVKDVITPGKMQQVMAQNPGWENLTPEELKAVLEQTQETDQTAAKTYAQEQLATMEQCAASSEEIYHILEQFDLPNSIQNIMAVESMMSERNKLFKQLFGDGKTDRATVDDIRAIKEDLLEAFGEAVGEPEALAVAQETLGEVAENVMKTMIDSDEVTTIDIKEMRLMQAKLSINGIMAKKEQYSVPVLCGDEVTNVSLKIVRGVDTKGIVDIMLQSQMTGKIAATFQAKEEGISGLIATDNADSRDLLAGHLGMFAENLQQSEPVDMRVALVEDLDLNHFSGASLAMAGQQENGESAAYEIQTSRLYHIAESFIQTLKELM